MAHWNVDFAALERRCRERGVAMARPSRLVRRTPAAAPALHNPADVICSRRLGRPARHSGACVGSSRARGRGLRPRIQPGAGALSVPRLLCGGPAPRTASCREPSGRTAARGSVPFTCASRCVFSAWLRLGAASGWPFQLPVPEISHASTRLAAGPHRLPALHRRHGPLSRRGSCSPALVSCCSRAPRCWCKALVWLSPCPPDPYLAVPGVAIQYLYWCTPADLVADLDAAYSYLTSRRPCGPNKEARSPIPCSGALRCAANAGAAEEPVASPASRPTANAGAAQRDVRHAVAPALRLSRPAAAVHCGPSGLARRASACLPAFVPLSQYVKAPRSVALPTPQGQQSAWRTAARSSSACATAARRCRRCQRRCRRRRATCSASARSATVRQASGGCRKRARRGSSASRRGRSSSRRLPITAWTGQRLLLLLPCLLPLRQESAGATHTYKALNLPRSMTTIVLVLLPLRIINYDQPEEGLLQSRTIGPPRPTSSS